MKLRQIKKYWLGHSRNKQMNRKFKNKWKGMHDRWTRIGHYKARPELFMHMLASNSIYGKFS